MEKIIRIPGVSNKARNGRLKVKIKGLTNILVYITYVTLESIFHTYT